MAVAHLEFGGAVVLFFFILCDIKSSAGALLSRPCKASEDEDYHPIFPEEQVEGGE